MSEYVKVNIFLICNKMVTFNWSLSNKQSSHSFVDPDSDQLSGWTTDQLSPSGRYVVERLKKRQ